MEFTCRDFTTFDFTRLNASGFVYADPPYTLGTAVYNDRPHGTHSWTVDDGRRLFNLLDRLNARGIRFDLSNVMEHKGRIDEPLQEWVENKDCSSIQLALPITIATIITGQATGSIRPEKCWSPTTSRTASPKTRCSEPPTSVKPYGDFPWLH
ncbi:DNA adenine methylase [Bifidobacterium animalis]|uniref:DNA adenine methylase n=1 Tax=Bifidobacterium animalis TaxID=28025 RepID=UPI003BF9D6AE